MHIPTLTQYLQADEPPPRPARPKRAAVKINALSFGKMLGYLVEHGNASVEEIADETGLHPNTIREWLVAWKRLGIIHIGSWDRDCRGRPTILRYYWGPGKDAKRPSLTMQQVRANYVARQRAKKLAIVFKQQQPTTEAA